MNRITSVVRMHLRNRLTWLFMPWIIVSIIFTFQILLFAFFLKDIMTAYTGGAFAIYVYMLVLGATIPSDTFPFALGYSVRRTDYVLGTLATAIAVSVVWSVLLLLLSFVERDLTAGWGLGLYIFHLPYLNDGPLIGQLWVYFVILVHLFLLGFFPANIYQRFGSFGVSTFFILVAVLYGTAAFTLTYFNWWGSFFGPLAQYSAVELASWGALLMIIYAFMSYVLLRRAIVR